LVAAAAPQRCFGSGPASAVVRIRQITAERVERGGGASQPGSSICGDTGMRYVIAMLFIAMLSAGIGGPAVAHDVNYTLQGSGEAYVIFDYQDGSPMARAEFAVFGPDSGGQPETSGIADAAGGVRFRASADGVWRVEVHDAAGHVSRARISFVAGVPALAGREVPIWITAGSVGANLLLLSYIFRERRAGRGPTRRGALPEETSPK
jgi:hypothetical protein